MTDPKLPNYTLDAITKFPEAPIPMRPPEPKESLIVKRGEAIAHVRTLEETVERQRQQIADGFAALRNCENQRDLLDEDRRKWRADAEIYRTILIELATEMKTINHHTTLANEIHKRVMNLLARETTEPENEEPPIRPGTDAFEKNLEHQIQKMRDATNARSDSRTASEILDDIAGKPEV